MKIIFIFFSCIALIAIQASFVHKAPADKAEFGKLLFFDPILSGDGIIMKVSFERIVLVQEARAMQISIKLSFPAKAMHLMLKNLAKF